MEELKVIMQRNGYPGIVCIFLILLSFKGGSQNLVPNHSFETYTDCPDFIENSNPPDNVGLAAPWYLPTGGSGDYLNQCGDGYNECSL